jgi:hypothetical protein
MPGLLPVKTTDPPHSCEIEASVELVTERLAELVNAKLLDARRTGKKRPPKIWWPKSLEVRRVLSTKGVVHNPKGSQSASSSTSKI